MLKRIVTFLEYDKFVESIFVVCVILKVLLSKAKAVLITTFRKTHTRYKSMVQNHKHTIKDDKNKNLAWLIFFII